MRNLFSSKYMYLTAAMLTGAAMFTSCSNEDDMGNVNPTYDGESVKTQFAINIPAAGKADTRLADNIVQSDGATDFRGMSNIRLVPFIQTSTTVQDGKPLTGADVVTYNPILLSTIDGVTAVGATNDNYKVYSNVDIPVGTNAFLFYGEAKPENTKQKNGSLIPSYEEEGWNGTALSNLSFDLEQILPDDNITGNTAAQTEMLDILNDIISADGWASESNNTFATLLTNFKALKAGSANSILLAVQDLYNTINNNNGSVTGTEAVKTAINDKIDDFFTPAGTAPNATLTFTSATYKDYPRNLGLPDGAVQVEFNKNSDNLFDYVTNVDYDSDLTGALDVADLTKYTYPASLWYWTNTSLRTSTTQQSDNYGSQNSWSNIIDLYDENRAVLSTTQSVVMTQPINYAVARFDLKVRFKGEIADNGDQWPSGAPVGGKIVTIPADGMLLTGILIGGQNTVNWDFSYKGGNETTIYDNYIGDDGNGVGIVSENYNTEGIHSLALETEAKSGTDKTVRFALEFNNNSAEEFVGADGIIPVVGKFYLVGELSTNPGTESGETASNYIFQQDHTTIANVSITSLKSAYNCIPDLRSPKLELGLSVNLEWQAGLVDNVTID